MLHDDIDLTSRTSVPVLITSDSRNQRQTRARLIHATGSAASGPFVTYSAAESGDAMGTDLRQTFERARGGTLFVDDVGKLSTVAQEDLCELLQEYAPAPANSTRTASGVRVIAGASQHLDSDLQSGIFCEALFYRLNIVHINLLPERALDAVGVGAGTTERLGPHTN